MSPHPPSAPITSVEGKTSMLQDLEAGRRTEVDIFGGHVVSLGLEHGVQMPLDQAVAHIINARTQHGLPHTPATQRRPERKTRMT